MTSPPASPVGHGPGGPAPAKTRPGSARRLGPALAVLATAQFLVVLTTSIVNVALPALGTGLGLSTVGLSWTVNAYVLAFGALLLPGGRLGDLLGRRTIFLVGTAVFIAGSAVAGLAGGPAVLLAARVVQGVGAGLLAPTALGLVLALFPPGAGRARAMAVWGAVSGTGGAAGVLFGGLLTEAAGWRWVFLAGIPIALGVLACALWLVPPDTPAGGRIDLPGAVAVTAGLALATYGLSGAARDGWAAATVLGPLLGGGILLALFAFWQTRAESPLVRPAVLRMGGVASANALMTLVGGVWIGLFFFLPLYQQKVLGYSPVKAGLTQLPLALAMTGASWLTPRAARRLGSRTALALSLALAAGGLLWLSRTPSGGSAVLDLALPSLPIGIGLGAVFVLLTNLSAAGVPPADAGLAGGLINTTRQIGGALGLALLTAVAAPPRTHASPGALAHDYGAALRVAAAIAALAALLSLFVRKEAREP
ncbi:MFS transporter [Actinomadura rubrisoli]|uniref:MFS transporter n=1 Tax=Actinomadura rubrisoli TaxID=2530368 RepID=A0A4R5C0S0_9ACTN|nr:MFS transporter [Actinomadura rubrisoli]TDD91836.1 MFS transporter [Actinomadura rubrisoli]